MRDGCNQARERGAILILWLLAIVMVSAALLVERAQGTAAARRPADESAARALGRARAALIAWAVTYPPRAAGGETPGLLPFPDRGRDGNYDGQADCVSPGMLRESHLLGRFPSAGHTAASGPCAAVPLHVDVAAGGDALWYAVSRNLVKGAGAEPLNPDIVEPGRARYPWLKVYAGDGSVLRDPRTGGPLAVAAVLIAPGPPLPGQDRRGAAPAPEAFLDRIEIAGKAFDNADADGCADHAAACEGALAGEAFVLAPDAPRDGAFNDRLVTITAQELMRAVEKRVLGEAAVALEIYRERHGTFPWLAPFGDPRASAGDGGAYRASAGVRRGLLPVHLRDEIFSTAFTARWHFVDGTPALASAHSGLASLVPVPGDALAGAADIPLATGRCLWERPERAVCAGGVETTRYRADLGIEVARRVEISFDLAGELRTRAPSADDVRRRDVSVNTHAPGYLDAPRPAPSLPGVAWSVRVTDSAGGHWGRLEAAIDADTRGTIALEGIAFDLSVVYDDADTPADELPEWLVENGWHALLHVALSAPAAPGGSGHCTPGEDCLRVVAHGDATLAREANALLVSAGGAWHVSSGPAPFSVQSRDTGVGDCDWDLVPDAAGDFLCAYLEGENNGGDADVFASGPASHGYGEPFSPPFNDQLRVIDPPPALPP